MKLKIQLFMIMLVLWLFPAAAFAATPLHDLPPGTIITFSGKQWMILDQMPDGTTYIILNSNDGNRAFDPDNTQLFNPSDSNNIGYYLNNTFYNSLSQKDLIVDHSWNRKYENGSGSQANVTCKIALISYAEYQTYRSLFPANGTGYWWWTRTPYSGSSSGVWYVSSNGGLYYSNAYATGGGVRPALYLKSGLMVSDTNEVLGEQATQPSAPAGLSGQAIGPTEVQLNWQPNTEPDLAGYIIYRNGTEVARVGNSTTSYTDNGLIPNTSYTYSIKAYNTFGLTSNMSNTVTVTTPKPPVPTNLTVSNITSTGAMVTWDPVQEAESYNVYLNDFLYAAYVTDTSYNITGLDPATSYTVRVTTVISNVEGDPAATTFTTLVGYKPKLTVRVDNRQIIMSWESIANSFIVEVNGQQITTTSDKQYTYTAEPGTYEIRVIAVVDGQQYPSDPVTVNVSAFNTPGVVEAAKDILGNTAAVIFPFGGLIALGLALKASPFLIAAIKNGILIRWFRGW